MTWRQCANTSVAAFLFVSMYPVLSTVPGTRAGFQYITNSQFICCINPDFSYTRNQVSFVYKTEQHHSFICSTMQVHTTSQILH